MATAFAMDGETLDALCWRTLGRTAGVTEQALALNPGLAAQGPLLAAGQAIELPELTSLAADVRETVNLWN